MKMLVILLFLAGSFCSCGPPADQSTSQQDPSGTTDTTQGHPADYTFLKIYHTAINDTVYEDTMYLKLHMEQDSIASGTYLWFIPQKDGKYGKISGRLSHDTLYGYYNYQQEGGNYKDSVRVVLQKDKAIVTQYNAPQSRLTDTLLNYK